MRLGGQILNDVIDPGRVADLFAAGSTIVAQSLHRTCPPVRDFVAELASDISHPLQANAYLTPPGGVGLKPHADRHDVFVVQVDGVKRWQVDGQDACELRPGDVLYIPAGTTHSAMGTDVSSLHLTIGVLRVTYRSVIDRLVDAGPETLDAALPLRYRKVERREEEPDPLRTFTEQALHDVIEHLSSLDVGLVIEAERNRSIRRPPATGQLRAALSLTDLRSRDRLRRTRVEWQIHVNKDRIKIDDGDCWFTAPLTCRRALEQLNRSSDDAIRVDELVGLDSTSQLIVARRLVRAGLCIVSAQTTGD